MAEADAASGPSWGQVAIPAGGLSVGLGPLMTIGSQINENTNQALRSRNFDAFKAFQEMYPNATAGQLSAEADKLSGGNNYLRGTLGASDIMQSLSDKNQEAYRATEAKNQTDINTGYQQAWDQAALISSDPQEFAANAERFVAPDQVGVFRQYMAGQDTGRIFSVYQTKMTDPYVKMGIEQRWGEAEFTAALGPKAGKVAFDRASTVIKEAEAKTAADLATQKATTQAELARANAGNAQAAAEVSRARQQNMATLQLQGQMGDAANKYLETLPQRSDIVVGFDQNDPAKKQQLHDSYFADFLQNNPQMDPTQARALFDAHWNLLPDKLAAAAQLNSVAIVQNRIAQDVQTTLVNPTQALVKQLDNKTQALAMVPTAKFTGVDGKTVVDPSGLDDTHKVLVTDYMGRLLAGKDTVTTDPDALLRIVTEGVVNGQDFNTIQSRVNRYKSGNGEPLVSDQQGIVLNRLNGDPSYNASPTSVPEMQANINSMVQNAQAAVGVEVSALSNPDTAGKDQSVAVRSEQSIQNAINKIEGIEAALSNPTTSALYTQGDQKKSATVAWLRNQKDKLENLKAQLYAQRDKHPGVYGQNTVKTAAGTPVTPDTGLTSTSPVLAKPIADALDVTVPQRGAGAQQNSTIWLKQRLALIDKMPDDPATASLKLMPKILNKAYEGVATLAVPQPSPDDKFKLGLGTPKPVQVPDRMTVVKLVKGLFDTNTSTDPSAPNYLPANERFEYEKNMVNFLLSQSYQPPAQ